MKKVTITDEAPLKQALPTNGEDVVLIRDGHAVALVTTFDDDDLDWYAQEHDPAFIESIRRAREQAASGQTISHEELMRTLGVSSTKQLLEDLVTESGALTIANAERQLPREPGFYAIFVDDVQSLPDYIGEHLRRRHTKLIYFGIASASLRERLFEQDLRHRRPSTFFRTLGAVLARRPVPGSLARRANKQNYSFTEQDTGFIARWIDAHVRVKWLVAHSTKPELESIEREMIHSQCPALNLVHNPEKIARLEELRCECRKIATASPAAE